MYVDLEKRKFYRIPIKKNLCYEHLRENIKNNSLYDGFCIDISQGGICILTDFYLKKRDIIKLFIPINSLNLSNPIIARVIWTRYEKGFYKTGLQFIKQ